MQHGTPQVEGGVHRPQGAHPIGFGHHAAGADLAGGDQLDVDARFGKAAEHAGGGARGAGHAGTDGADSGDGRPLLEARPGPLAQQGRHGLLGPGQVVALEHKAHVATRAWMGALRLHDRIEADAGIGQGAADGRGGAGSIGQALHRHLGLAAVEGDAAHGGIAELAGARVGTQVLLGQFEGLAGCPQGLLPLLPVDKATHLHLAGGDQPQVDAVAGQGVEQLGRHARPAHDSGTGDAQLGQARLGPELGAAGVQGCQHFPAHQLGPVGFGRGQGEGDVVGGAFMGGLHDQVDVEAGIAQGLK